MMDARIERLSIKLQEISSKQLSRDANVADIEGNISGMGMASCLQLIHACKRENLSHSTGNQNEAQICDTKSGNGMPRFPGSIS
jgi:hypothetical protein